MTPINFLAIAAGVFVFLVFGTGFVRRLVLRSRQKAFAHRRVFLEEVTAFKVKGCQHCGSSGAVKRPVNGQKSWMPCECASRGFLAKHGRDTKMLGPFRIWKRGRRPSNVQRIDARRGARSAAA